MAKFMYLFREGPRPNLAPAELAAHLAKWSAWMDGLAKAGHMLPGGEPLELTGKTLRGGSRTLSDGPFAEAKDLVTGVLFIAAETIDAAVALARECPIFLYDGSVEVRPIMAMAMPRPEG
jgi:hypothetical protein